MLRWTCELLLALLARALLPLLPRGAILRLSRWLGDAGYARAARLRRVTLANLELAFPALDTSRREQIARESFRAAARVLLDIFWFAGFTERRLERYVHGSDDFLALPRMGAVVAITAHLGSWEVLGLKTAATGTDITSVAMPLKNPWVDRLLNRLRTRTGQKIAEREGALRALMAAIKRNAMAALLLDQNTPPDEGGEFVDFFGRPVPISRVAGRLADHSDCPIIGVFCIARPDGTYDIHVSPLPDGAAGDSATQRIARMLEAEVRAAPEQWLWSYKRWKFVPGGQDAKHYPFYARPAPPVQEGQP